MSRFTCAARSGIFTTCALALALNAAPAAATGWISCDSGDRAGWRSKEDLETQMLENGWQKVRKVKVDGGCYEAYATTADGQKVEAYFDPVTLEKLLVHRRGNVLFLKDGIELDR